ncbi:hypothetical protein NA57DRAFT_76005 [Rhizodiscina lignyota]|uniref:Fungal N-terminal domain-containing protein n=1 Tax=Rhizodiscina lignyota TaxID=1504668 RepID=A0A9P4IBD2_9PEZI|nr:hypothetical protein NA57DRAFT_76005 [Rhizodiscina lignyota]
MSFVDALRESSNSGAVFRSLLNQLETLQDALLRVQRLELEESQHAELLALQQAAAQCQRTIDDFWRTIQKYQPRLRKGGSGSRIKDSWAKIKWVTCKKEDLESFRAQIQGHISSIEFLLSAVQINAATIREKRRNQQQKTLAGLIVQFSNDCLSKLSENIDQGRRLLEASGKIISLNLQVFSAIYDIQQYIRSIPRQVGGNQEPVYMIDALGRHSPFHLEFVRSAEALTAVLKVNFKSTGVGAEMIERGDFVIQDMGTRRDIDLSDDWETSFFPGQRVAMSMVFKRSFGFENPCPGCGNLARGALDEDVTW